MNTTQVILLALFAPPAAFAIFTLARWWSPRRHPDTPFLYHTIRCLLIVLTRIFYRTRLRGLANIPAKGGVILIANHVSYADVTILGACCDRPIRFLSWAGFEKTFFSRLIMRSMRTIPISPDRAREAVRLACESLEQGGLICIFPEGRITRSGALNSFRAGYELIAKNSGAPVVPAFIDGLWGSVFSHRNGRPFRQIPTAFPRRISVRFGPVLASADMYSARSALLDLGAEAFAEREAVQEHLLRAVVRAGARRPGRVAIIDLAAARTVFTHARTIAVARALGERLRELAPERRIGVILPPGIPGCVANLACVFAGKIPVNFNFTLGRAALEHCFQKSGVKTVLTAGAFRAKVSEKLDVPWPENTIDALDEMRRLPKARIIAGELAVRLLPGRLLCSVWGIPEIGGEEEATLLFTSGSAGTPKGVPLSHRNILANSEQIFESGIVPSDGRLLSNLPIFHSFGHTVGVWFALTRHASCVCLPSPLDTKRNLEAIRDEEVNTLIGTPTFYRAYLKRAESGPTPSLTRVIAGAEKTPAGFAKEWEERIGGVYYEGYGVTEASPVVAVNVPDTPDSDAAGGMALGKKSGSVGRLVVGMSARVRDAITGEEVGFGKPGLLFLRGANVFGGYLEDPEKTRESFLDGFYSTGDLVRIDEDGFVFIEGRLARFSKIGGEMVPHGAVEEAVMRALELSYEGEHRLAVSERACPKKGEELVLLTTFEIDGESLRKKLSEAGLANLWIPRSILRVTAIPVLATGKLDLRELRRLAAEGCSAE